MTDIEIIQCEQGGKEWHQARAGVITASMMGEVLKVAGGLDERQSIYVEEILNGVDELQARSIAGYKSKPTSTAVQRALAGEKVGDFTEAAKAYAFRLAIERINGEPLDEGAMQTYAMQRGNELEPAARAEHSMRIGKEIKRAGFVRTKDGKFGASADGIIQTRKKGGSEYKCLIDPVRIRSIIIDRNIDEFLPQVYACLWLTGFEWWHFCLYCPALESIDKHLTVVPLTRDESFIEDMEAKAIEFDCLVEQYRADILAHDDEFTIDQRAEETARGIFGA